MQSMPMYTPRICLRITANHSVVASPVPWIGCQGSFGRAMPASASCRPVAI